MPPHKKAKNAAAHKRQAQRRTESQGADYYREGKAATQRFVDLYDFAPIMLALAALGELKKPI